MPYWNEWAHILVLAYGLNKEGGLLPETMARLQAALAKSRRLRQKRPGRRVSLVVANTTELGSHSGPRVMGEVMSSRLRDMAHDSEDVIFVPEQMPGGQKITGGENTGGEVAAMLDYVAAFDPLDGSHHQVGFASSWYHVPRLVLIFLALGHWPWPIAIAWSHFSWKADVVVEFSPIYCEGGKLKLGKFWGALVLLVLYGLCPRRWPVRQKMAGRLFVRQRATSGRENAA